MPEAAAAQRRAAAAGRASGLAAVAAAAAVAAVAAVAAADGADGALPAQVMPPGRACPYHHQQHKWHNLCQP